MSKTKFDLYNDEWLDIVFSHRNKAYGAYDLRHDYVRNMSKAMGYAFAGIAVLIIASFVFRPKPAEVFKFTQVELPIKPIKIQPPIKAELKKQNQPVKQAAAPAKPAAPVHTIENLPPVVVPTTPPVDPPKTVDLQTAAIGSKNIDGPATMGNGGGNTTDGKGPGDGGVGKGDEIYTGGLDVMPEPYGGAAAWSKFLQRTIRFPGAAQEQGVSGRVILSFVIEKDGQLSNIKVDRKAGFGFDEEALRVLKLAKAWKPGMQNGQPVRVRYVIPINFQLADQD